MKTKDVRHLCLCPVCGKLGDERLMLRAGPMECLAHDRCVFANSPKASFVEGALQAVMPEVADLAKN